MTLFMGACGISPGSSTFLALNPLEFECSSHTVDTCESSAISRPVYLGLTLSFQLDCEELIRRGENSGFSSVFAISSTTLTRFNGTALSGQHTDFVNEDNETVIEIEDGRYLVCSYIDINENKLLDSGEPLLESTYDLRWDVNPLLSDWQKAL